MCKSGMTALILYSRPVCPGNGVVIMREIRARP
nr:MAG TPA: hypothetical protein [Caudoviricetes sp.]